MIVHISEFTSPKNELVRILILPLLLIKPMDLAGSSYVMLFFRKYTCFPLPCNDLATIRLDVIKRIEKNTYNLFIFLNKYSLTTLLILGSQDLTSSVPLVALQPSYLFIPLQFTYIACSYLFFALKPLIPSSALSLSDLSLKAEALRKGLPQTGSLIYTTHSDFQPHISNPLNPMPM